MTRHLARLMHRNHELPSHFWPQPPEGVITAAFDDLHVVRLEAAVWYLDRDNHLLVRADPHRITARKFDSINHNFIAHSDKKLLRGWEERR